MGDEQRVGVGVRVGFMNEMLFGWGDEEWVGF